MEKAAEEKNRKNIKIWKLVLIILGVIIVIILLLTNFITNFDFSNQIYFKCLDIKTSSISIDSLYSDSYDVTKECNSVKSKAFFKKNEYDKCIKDETVKIGNTFKEYIEYMHGGYNKENGCTGYANCKPYEYFASQYKNEDEALIQANKIKESKCIYNLLK